MVEDHQETGIVPAPAGTIITVADADADAASLYRCLLMQYDREIRHISQTEEVSCRDHHVVLDHGSPCFSPSTSVRTERSRSGMTLSKSAWRSTVSPGKLDITDEYKANIEALSKNDKKLKGSIQ